MFDYDALLDLSANYDSRTVYLSGFSYALILSCVEPAQKRYFWRSAGEPVDDTTWDTIDNLASNLMRELVMNVDIGAVIPLMVEVIPEAFLLCDGGTYNREDYPDLYAVLPSSLILTADTFTLPDMAGLAAVGATVGRPLLTVFGEETHTLSEAELASHAHTYTPPILADLDIEGVGVPTPSAAVGFPTQTSSAGGGQPHNNLQPSISLYWCIRAR